MTTLVRAPQTVFAPRQPHRRAEHRQIHVTHHRTVLDLCTTSAGRTKSRDLNLLDQQFHIRPGASIGEHPHVLQPDQRLDDPARLRHDEGATVFALHTSKTAAPSSPIRKGHAEHKERRRQGRPPRQDPKTQITAGQVHAGTRALAAAGSRICVKETPMPYVTNVPSGTISMIAAEVRCSSGSRCESCCNIGRMSGDCAG